MTIPRNPAGGASAGDKAGRGASSAANTVRAPRFTLKPSKQTAAILGGAMGLVVIGCVGLYAWQSAELADIQKQVNEKQDELASGQKIASKLESVRADFNTTQSQLRYLETSVTEDEYVPSLLHQIEALAKSVDMQVDSIRPQFDYASKAAPAPKKDDSGSGDKAKAPPPPPYDRLNIDMQMHGNYWDTAKLLYKLTEFPKIMAVQSVELHPMGQAIGGMSPSLQVHMTLTGFVFPVVKPGDPGAPGAASAPSAAAAPGAPVGAPAGPGTPGAAPAGPGATAPGSAPGAPAPGGTAVHPQQPSPARSQAPQQRAMTTLAAPAIPSHGA